MNYLAHLWLTDAARLPLAGAILGDWVRGRLEDRGLPPALDTSIRLHRRVDVLTDRHAALATVRERFPGGARRYAGIVLDLICDHALARDWERFGSGESLPAFVRRAADAVVGDAHWFVALDVSPPRAWRLRRLLLSSRSERGIDRAVRRTAARLREPQALIAAAANWRALVPVVDETLPTLLSELRVASIEFAQPVQRSGDQ
jgi:acyl carrier protein phosphodiesterase